MDKSRFDIVQLVERRRKWPTEVIAQIMEEALAPGATVAGVADRHGVARSQVYGIGEYPINAIDDLLPWNIGKPVALRAAA